MFGVGRPITILKLCLCIFFLIIFSEYVECGLHMGFYSWIIFLIKMKIATIDKHKILRD